MSAYGASMFLETAKMFYREFASRKEYERLAASGVQLRTDYDESACTMIVRARRRGHPWHVWKASEDVFLDHTYIDAFESFKKWLRVRLDTWAGKPRVRKPRLQLGRHAVAALRRQGLNPKRARMR